MTFKVTAVAPLDTPHAILYYSSIVTRRLAPSELILLPFL